MAPISVGSPRGVPVPCASDTRISVEAAAYTLRRSCVWADPLGAVKLALRPSCCVLTPARLATHWAAAGSRSCCTDCRITAPTPSPRT
eukprot:3061104-Prymnesium_polylepis.1